MEMILNSSRCFYPMLSSLWDDMKLYIDERKLTDEMKEKLAKDQISLHPYNAIYEDVKALPGDAAILVDSARLNYALYNNLPKTAKVIDEMKPHSGHESNEK